MRRQKKQNRTAFQTLTLVTQLGLTMVVSVGMASAVGVWLDRRFGTRWITILLFVMGVIAGGQSAYRMIRKIFEPEDKDKERDPSCEDDGDIKKS